MPETLKRAACKGCRATLFEVVLGHGYIDLRCTKCGGETTLKARAWLQREGNGLEEAPPSQEEPPT